MRGQIYSKSSACTKAAEVDVADISVEVSAHYPGRVRETGRPSFGYLPQFIFTQNWRVIVKGTRES
jgi:hypothetical protein